MPSMSLTEASSHLSLHFLSFDRSCPFLIEHLAMIVHRSITSSGSVSILSTDQTIGGDELVALVCRSCSGSVSWPVVEPELSRASF